MNGNVLFTVVLFHTLVLSLPIGMVVLYLRPRLGLYMLAGFLGGGKHNPALHLSTFLLMKLITTIASIGLFFLIYWLLPNGKVPARAVLPAAIIMGLLSEALKYAYILALPWLNFQEVYGPFALSVSMMFWAFLSGLLLLAGANLSAEEHVRRTL